MLAPDETAAAVARAQEVLAEITAREAADADRAARDTEEAARADELARWAGDDHADGRDDERGGHAAVEDDQLDDSDTAWQG